MAHDTSSVDPRQHPSVLDTVLVVDDDGQIFQLVAKFLRSSGFHVRTARNGVEMTESLRHGPVDLIVLDLMLPGANGLDLCRDLRRTSTVPVVMLTAKGDDVDRIIGLEIGADDYLAKPFNPRELLARINAVLRRSRLRATQPETARARTIAFAGWRLDTLKRELTDPAGVVVDLSAGEYYPPAHLPGGAAARADARVSPRRGAQPRLRQLRPLHRRPGEPAETQNRERRRAH